MNGVVVVCFFALVVISDALRWNETLGMRMLNYAAVAYCPLPVIHDWECTYCLGNVNVTNFFNDSETNTFGYAGIDYDNNYGTRLE